QEGSRHRTKAAPAGPRNDSEGPASCASGATLAENPFTVGGQGMQAGRGCNLCLPAIRVWQPASSLAAWLAGSSSEPMADSAHPQRVGGAGPGQVGQLLPWRFEHSLAMQVRQTKAIAPVVPEQYMVLLICSDEKQQLEILARFQAGG